MASERIKRLTRDATSARTLSLCFQRFSPASGELVVVDSVFVVFVELSPSISNSSSSVSHV
jgi:hypothetical protein